MRRKVIIWTVILLTGCYLAHAVTPGWDPNGSPIAWTCVNTPRGNCQGDCTGHDPPLLVYVGEQLTFHTWAGGDIDHQGDPIAYDHIHCDWYYREASENNNWHFMGKSKGDPGCQCEDYQQEGVTSSFPGPGFYTVKCEVNDCAIWADDPDATLVILPIFCVDQCSFTEILVPPAP